MRHCDASSCEVSVAGELPPQLAAGVVQRLVERATRRAETLGENVDRHTVDGEGDEDAALVGREGELDRVLDRRQQLRLLRRLVGLEAGTRDEIPPSCSIGTSRSCQARRRNLTAAS